MKTHKNKLNFSKNSLVELNKKELLNINGGTSDALPISSCICPIIFKTLTLN